MASNTQNNQPVNAYGQNAEQAQAMRTAMDPAAGCQYCPHICIGIGILLIIPGIVMTIIMISVGPFDSSVGPAGPFCLIPGIFLTLTGAMCFCQRRRVRAMQAAGLPIPYYHGRYAGSAMPPPASGIYPQSGAYQHGAYPPGAYPPGAYPAGAYPPGAYPAGAYPPGAYHAGGYPPTEYPQGAPPYPGNTAPPYPEQQAGAPPSYDTVTQPK